MITQNNLEKIRNYKETGLLTLELLKQFGFHIGDVAYLIETGRLIDYKNGFYGCMGAEKIKTNSKDLNHSTPEIYLSLLENEEKRFDINTCDSEWNLLEEKSRYLEKTKGILILKAMSKERRHKIYKFVRGIPSLRAFPLDKYLENKRVVLKFHMEEHINIKELIKEGKEAYNNQDFWLCIKNYLKVLAHLQKPNSHIYAKIGLAYMQVFEREKAILYLTVANELYKEEGKSNDLTDLLENLKFKRNGIKVEKDEKKFFVFFHEEEFQDDINKYYGIEAIEEMMTFVSSGKPIEEIISMFSLTEEQITLFLLILARNCYANKDYSLGNKYLKQVEKRKHKTEFVKQLLEEIRRNKRFYQNRKENGTKTLRL